MNVLICFGMGRSIIRTILEDHRELELYKRAMTDIVLMLRHKDANFIVQRYKDVPDMSYIIQKIKELKSLKELKPTQH